MNRQDSNKNLNDHLNSLSNEKLGDFAVSWEKILPEPPTSDAEFLVNLRKALPEKSPRRAFFGGLKYVWRATAVCSIVFLVVLSGGKWTQNNSEFFAAGNSDVEWGDVTGWAELSATVDSVDPDVLADSLMLTSSYNDWDSDLDSSSDSEILLTLDDEDFEAVLNEIQAIHVFAVVGS